MSDRRAISYGPDDHHFAHLWLPDGPAPSAGWPIVTLIHGGFWRSKWALDLMDPMAASLIGDRCAVWNIEYRRVGHDGGGWPGTGDDVVDAINHLMTIAGDHQLDLGRHAVVGHSAGGHLALWSTLSGRLATSPKLAIGLAPASDLHAGWAEEMGDGAITDFLGGTPDEVPAHYAAASPAALLNDATANSTAQAIIEGTADNAVPVEHVRAYVEKVRSSLVDVTYDEFDDVGHMEVIDPDHDVWATTRARLFAAVKPLVVLTGFMGTGKSTTGAALADALGVDFVDTDAEIESAHGPIPEIFAAQGEDHFRALEREVITSVALRTSGVIATGGGLILDPENRRTLTATCRIFTLTAAPEQIIERVGTGADRPLLAGPDPATRIGELLSERKEIYDLFETVRTDGQTPEAVANELVNRLRTPSN